MTDARIITATAELEAFCTSLEGEAFVTVDTEFIREKTYYPLLCLVQVAGAHDARAIDPLAPGIDLAPLTRLLANHNILKVFHAARQDMEIFYHLSGTLPAPVFDTQVAAQFCGFGESVSYSELVQKTLNITIDKGSRFTDWARRPLSERQLVYALDDVLHLRESYTALIRRLQSSQRMQWIEEDMAALADTGLYRPDPENAWRRIKSGNMKPKQLAVLQAAARWREEEAMRLDIPRPRVARDETLAEIAAVMPHSMEDLKHVRGTGHIRTDSAKALLQAVDEAKNSPPESWPTLPPRQNRSPNGDALVLLQMLLAVQCRRHNILPRLVASRDELEAIASGDINVKALHDWRAEMFGEKALKLLKGQLQFSFDPQTKQAQLKED